MHVKETNEQRNQRFRDRREEIAAALLEKYPKVTFDRRETGIDVIYHFPYFYEGEVRFRSGCRGIHTSDFDLAGYYLTKEDAEAAIIPHLHPAQLKFENCLSALNVLKSSMGFDVSYCVEGDTHGVEDYPYIAFEMGGFSFTFRIWE
jgi:hypothetical protein